MIKRLTLPQINKIKELTGKIIPAILKKIQVSGGIPYLVGGTIRDILLKKEIKDIDIEVHKLSSEQLQKILGEFGQVELVGKSFGVYKLFGINADWSLPRRDSKGRKPKVEIDPEMTIEKALERRDLTINAMAVNLNNYELVDPFDGQEDLKNKILRSPNIKFFPEDPLRFYRVMQFISRFQMLPDQELENTCKEMEIKNVSKERIEDELKKLFLKSEYPSLGFRWLSRINRLNEIFPELAVLKKIPQDQSWHPEGNVLEHTMQAIDAAAGLQYENETEKLIIMYAALCHDLGKVSTTIEIDGRIKSPGHETAGVPIAKSLLHKITNTQTIIDAVLRLVRYHMAPTNFIKAKAKPAAYKRLATKLGSQANIKMLYKLALVDKRGRNSDSHKPLTIKIPDLDKFLKTAKKIGVETAKEAPILMGRDLLRLMPEGPEMGKILKKAYELQINKGIKNKKQLILLLFVNKLAFDKHTI